MLLGFFLGEALRSVRAERPHEVIVADGGSTDATRAIAEADPLFTAGLRTFEVREWTVMEGSLVLKVNFSDQ